MMIKLIAIDLDGTLLNENSAITRESIETINKAMDEGVRIVLCSGRPMSGLYPYIKELGLDEDEEYIISQNGSKISTANNEIIKEILMEEADVNYLVDLADKEDVGVCIISGSDNYYAYNYSTPAMEHDADLVFLDVEVLDRDLSKMENNDPMVVMAVDEKDKLDRFTDKYEAEISKQFEFVRSCSTILEFLNRGIGKGPALLYLADYLNLDISEVMVIGDELNDLSMFEIDAFKVAMGNAHQDIKDRADYITLANSEDGVGHAIKKFVL